MKPNILDRMIGYVSPEAGLRRLAARSQADVIEQAYDGAATGRRVSGWNAPSTSGSAEVMSAGTRLVSRSREMCRNDANFISARREVRNYSVGTGIEIQFEDVKWQELWDDWCKVADADGRLPFYGLQSLAATTIFESGSLLIRRRNRLPIDNLPVPLQVELLEPDFLDRSKDVDTLPGGGYIRNGVEFNGINKRVAYHLYGQHPGDSARGYFRQTTSSRIDASFISHAYVVDRPGQITGVPWGHGAMIRARDEADYEDAELYRKKIEACSVGAVTQAAGITGSPLNPAPSGVSGAGEDGDMRAEMMEPGTFHYFRQGEEVTFNDPKGNTAYEAFIRNQDTKIGSALGVPYSKLTGDLTQANYSSLRAGGNQFEQSMDVFRSMTLVPGVCEPVLRWFVEMAIASKAAPSSNMPKYKWQYPPYPEVDQVKGAMSRQLDVRSGFVLPEEVIRSRGGDPQKHLEKLQEWNNRLDELEIVVDSDPRRVARSGVSQFSDPLALDGEKDEDGGSFNGQKKN